MAVSDIAFPDYPEARHYFEERQRLSPDTCFVNSDDGGFVKAYLVSYPWKWRNIPALNTPLGELPQKPECIYIHDLALHPDLRGSGATRQVVTMLKEAALSRRLPRIALMAVNGSVPFWEKHGFVVQDDETLVSQTAKYGADARYMSLDIS
ncbi:GNAT family N-acetyltransferase [Limoniibacter endophyticus]|nr:GNAT family N-acetyltransferase [Limoniibacter endophyticus]